jgi:uncharacterized repeat protein (TIGR03847 family)
MDLGPVDHIVADAIGEPGFRIFYLQARHGPELVTVIMEKQQVQLLATSVQDLLADVVTGTEAGTGDDEESLALEEPLEPRWRAGRLSIGFDRENDLFVLEVEEYQPDLDPDEDDPRSILEGEPETIRILASRSQMQALSRHGAAVAERGRPLCQLCGNPMDPEGHACPATNGHRKPRA